MLEGKSELVCFASQKIIIIMKKSFKNLDSVIWYQQKFQVGIKRITTKVILDILDFENYTLF